MPGDHGGRDPAAQCADGLSTLRWTRWAADSALTAPVWRPSSTDQGNLDALIAPALAADPEHPDAADLGDVAHVRAAAGLQVDVGNAEQADAAGAARRLHAHGLDQLRSRVELRIGNPHRCRFHAARDQGV